MLSFNKKKCYNNLIIEKLFLRNGPEVVVRRGEKVLLDCRPHVVKEWFFMKRYPHPIIHKRVNDSFLVLVKVQPKDTGHYICYAWNNATNSYAMFTTTIKIIGRLKKIVCKLPIFTYCV